MKLDEHTFTDLLEPLLMFFEFRLFFLSDMTQSFIDKLMRKSKGYGLYCSQPPGGNQQLLGSISWWPCKGSNFVLDLQNKICKYLLCGECYKTVWPDLWLNIENKYKKMSSR